MDGIERDTKGRARVVRVDSGSSLGQELGGRFGIRALPTTIVLDGQGVEVGRYAGLVDKASIMALVSEATKGGS